MRSYLVEMYVPRSRTRDADAAGCRARAAAEELSREGVQVRYVSTTFLPDDETCLHLFKAASAEVVEEAISLAALGHARVVPAIELSRPSRRRAK